MDATLLKQFVELGWPGIITAFFAYLAIQYIKDQREQIAYLRQRLDQHEAKLNSLTAEVQTAKELRDN